ncbi:exodeoxyribonuclease III [Actinomadura sp. NBRC 104425]|uniref:endonuclease/exonuclease/phosphatase family protein n=1 Tax=Actinomadura sp. NBRC 104425 TaxID=3032204 RepID=UPI0024A17FF8|nr:endonuclease/exonuclease/phosphatase family protein [Actinomadura sp. NBRC 104425]GLZ15863.1 exodeoxyribonuclease III [Actinomadura sp. NBRC 104425]
MLSLLTINIGAAAESRADRILSWLATRPEQVFLLTETSSGRGTTRLLDRFHRAGYALVHTPTPGDRGTALVSKIPIPQEPAAFAKVSIPGRVAAAVLDTRPRLCVTSVYVPSRDRSAAKTDRKQQFITTLLQAIQALPVEHRDSLVLGGDYNVISRDHRPAHTGFLPFEYALLDSLRASGLVDAHEHCRPADQPHSWIGRTGDGYRYDYFHVSQTLADLLASSTYLHETRNPHGPRLTDHAAVSISLRADATALLKTSDPTTDDEATLF